MPFALLRVLVVAAATLAIAACDVVGPSCLARRDSGVVGVVSGIAPADGTTRLVLRYEPAGSQNTVHVVWPGAGEAGGPRLWFVATRTGCPAFVPDVGARPGDPCAVLAEAGQRAEGPVVTSMTITHGRGNPSVLGTPPEYLVWVMSAAPTPTPFTLDVRWSFGPDC